MTDFFFLFPFFSVQLIAGGILTVADDLLKNDGKKFIEMMEQLAERRMQREEEANNANGTVQREANNHHHVHNHAQPSDYDDEEYVEEDDDDEEDYEDDEEEDDEPVRLSLSISPLPSSPTYIPPLPLPACLLLLYLGADFSRTP